ncbi:MAG: hypothetical protein AAGA03_08885 [Planctomycetota bacterium]
MNSALLYAWSFSGWFWAAWRELCRYIDRMGTTEWAVMAAAAVAFGFLCLKGHSLKQ